MKLKKLLKETKVWERKFGEPLPTLEVTTQRFKIKQEEDQRTKQSVERIKEATNSDEISEQLSEKSKDLFNELFGEES